MNGMPTLSASQCDAIRNLTISSDGENESEALDLTDLQCIAVFVRARDIAIDCEWLDDDIYSTLDGMRPYEIVRTMASHYDGGMRRLVADALYDLEVSEHIAGECRDGLLERDAVAIDDAANVRLRQLANAQAAAEASARHNGLIPRGIPFQVTYAATRDDAERFATVYAADIDRAASLAISQCPDTEYVRGISQSGTAPHHLAHDRGDHLCISEDWLL